jgi:hypothetical protein
MLGPSMTVAHLAIATTCTALMIGLGFLARPGRATVLWSAMFAIAMGSAYGSIASDDLDSVPLWLVSTGAILMVPPLAWSGLRAARGATLTFAWLAPVLGVGAIATFLVSLGSPGFHVLARGVVMLCALTNVLVIIELARRPERGRGAALPLTLVSGIWIVMAVIGLVASALEVGEDYQLLTQSNAVGILVYLVAALVTLLLICRDQAARHAAPNQASFQALIADRLARAATAHERMWTLLDIRLDDVGDLRAATGEGGFDRLSTRFHSAVRSAFPAEADIAAVDDARALVLVSRTPAAVRTCARRLLDDLATMDADAPLGLQLSASIGWADVDTVGYDVRALLSAADRYALAAIADGGDRWIRA